ncbi:Cytochrome b-c1 complex subunit 9 [Zea mays]|uniref:Complex III subunit 9 n=1 Tax=Zea mays TaxID=4577 RepID=A0A3L6G3I9_MAIZE|nr:Cytochrome b-c1 complex subunit 9 [Zea mays]
MGLLDSLYRVVMRRNAVYVTFVVAGAFAGERVVDYGVHKIWEMNNLGIFIPDVIYAERDVIVF